jgi:hypothetical protein
MKRSQILKTLILTVIFSLGLWLNATVNHSQAMADTNYPKGNTYNVEQNEPFYQSDSYENDRQKPAAEKAESLKDELVEKLNLNEPLPKSTKKFIKQVKGEEPITDPIDR